MPARRNSDMSTLYSPLEWGEGKKRGGGEDEADLRLAAPACRVADAITMALVLFLRHQAPLQPIVLSRKIMDKLIRMRTHVFRRQLPTLLVRVFFARSRGTYQVHLVGYGRE